MGEEQQHHALAKRIRCVFCCLWARGGNGNGIGGWESVPTMRVGVGESM